MKMKLNLAVCAIVAFTFIGVTSCKDDSDPSTNNGGNQDNFNPFLKYELNGTAYETKKFTTQYGGKLFITGWDASGGIMADLALALKKDEVLTNVPFSIDASGPMSTGIFYVGSDQWMIGEGSFSVSEHTGNRLTGTFSGKAYQIDYAGQEPVKVDSGFLTNGVFNEILISE